MSSSPAHSEALFESLGEGVRNWIDSKRWTDFTEIQANAMPRILSGEGALIVAPTASGKTEAALLPIVSRIIEDRSEPIALLYIAPLRALINDQARRIATLVEECSLRAAWWHGDLPQSKRQKILARPPHALLTTPESIEVLLSADTYGHGALLGNVRFVLIDEIHAFATTDRGAQLSSLLIRLEEGKRIIPARIALSATIGSPEAVVSWMRSDRENAPPITIVRETGRKGRRIAVGLIPDIKDSGVTHAERTARNNVRLADVVAKHAAGKRLIIFGRSRQGAESLTLGLRERGVDALVHHGSLDSAIRRANEERFQQEGPKAIVATSTLELGIDIGDLETVIQIGPPSTVSSLLQRIGRSGRRAGDQSVGILYATDIEELPIVLAAGELALEDLIEPLSPPRAALHIAFHQVVNLVRERDAVGITEAIDILSRAGSFSDISSEEWNDLIAEIVDSELLELDRNRLRIGPRAERTIGFANYRDFYSVFQTDDVWTVRSGEQTIGTLDLTFPVSAGRDVFFVLAGRRWKVEAVDRERRVLRVISANRGAAPMWGGGGTEISYEIMQRAGAILIGSTGILETPALTKELVPLRARAATIGIAEQRIVVFSEKNGAVNATTFLGSATNYYLAALLGKALGTGVGATPSELIVNPKATQTVSEIAVILREIMISPERRSQLEAAVLDDAGNLPAVGKYWHLFGPKTRRHVLKRFLFDSDLHTTRLKCIKVVTAGTIF